MIFAKKKLLHQDNAPSHTSVVAMTKIYKFRFELLEYPSCLTRSNPKIFVEEVTFVNNCSVEKDIFFPFVVNYFSLRGFFGNLSALVLLESIEGYGN